MTRATRRTQTEGGVLTRYTHNAVSAHAHSISHIRRVREARRGSQGRAQRGTGRAPTACQTAAAAPPCAARQKGCEVYSHVVFVKDIGQVRLPDNCNGTTLRPAQTSNAKRRRHSHVVQPEEIDSFAHSFRRGKGLSSPSYLLQRPPHTQTEKQGKSHFMAIRFTNVSLIYCTPAGRVRPGGVRLGQGCQRHQGRRPSQRMSGLHGDRRRRWCRGPTAAAARRRCGANLRYRGTQKGRRKRRLVHIGRP